MVAIGGFSGHRRNYRKIFTTILSSVMSPTFVVYHEVFEKIENETVIQKYDKIFTGFFGNCRALIGMQVPLTNRLRIGSEFVFAYLNGLEVESGDLKDEGFKFPDYQWHFTFRYTILP